MAYCGFEKLMMSPLKGTVTVAGRGHAIIFISHSWPLQNPDIS